TLYQLLRARHRCLTIKATQNTRIVEQLAAREAIEQHQAVRQDAHGALRRNRVTPYVTTGDRDRSLVGAQHPGHHRQRRGLACTVRSHDAKNLPSTNIKVDARDGEVVAKTLRQSSN